MRCWWRKSNVLSNLMNRVLSWIWWFRLYTRESCISRNYYRCQRTHDEDSSRKSFRDKVLDMMTNQVRFVEVWSGLKEQVRVNSRSMEGGGGPRRSFCGHCNRRRCVWHAEAQHFNSVSRSASPPWLVTLVCTALNSHWLWILIDVPTLLSVDVTSMDHSWEKDLKKETLLLSQVYKMMFGRSLLQLGRRIVSIWRL